MIKIEISVTENLNKEEILKYQEILNALIKSGGLSGVKGGKTILHFDADAVFQGIELDYWPWRKRKSQKNVYDGR